MTYQLCELGCSRQLGGPAHNFLELRLTISETAEITTDRVCPRGSSSGPGLWLILMEGWFNKMKEIPLYQGGSVWI